MKFVIEHLSKSFEKKEVLRDIDFTFDEGKIYGLLGRNGAGKTTLFNCLNRDLKADSGNFYIEDENGVRREVSAEDIGYVLSTPTVPEFLTGREFLKFFIDINEKSIKNPKSIDEYFDYMSIEPEDRDKLLKDYSHGMKNKMQMLINIIAQPNILLLDEPLTSLDVVVAEEMKQLLRSLKQDRITIFSTHIMDLALDLCDEIVLLNHGELEVVEKTDLDSREFKDKIIAALREEGNDKTLKISFSLKNTYRVNGVLFSLKQIPLVKRLLPATLYQVKGLKIFANILSVLWEIVSVFLGKFLYFITMVCGIGILYNGLPENEVFLHILLILTVIGSFVNTHLFNPTKDKYYAMILMKMDAREYTLVNYFYSILKVVVGFLPFTILFGMDRGVPLWFCLLLPLCIAGMKLFAAAVTLWDYEKRGFGYNENKLSKYVWCCIALLLAAAYAPPAFGFALPAVVPMVIFLACIPLGMASITRLTTFRDYYAINKELLAGLTNQMDSTAQTKLIKQANEKKISADTSISSNRKGFEYLNELFIKRHKKILWNSTKKISYVCAFLVAAVLAGVYLLPEEKTVINEIVMTWLPYFVFIMYAINRGTNFTQALFMNCDHSLLTYSFYKQPSFILRLFQIRLREIMKINAVPALVIGIGLALILFATGGTDNPLNYVVLVVSILCMSLFFSIHYLTIYYLLQPYNAGTELKSGTYRIVLSVTYVVCFALMRLRMPIMIFGIMTIVFCVLYSIVASILVYRFAPKTFRLRT